MSVIATVTIPAEEFSLGAWVTASDGVTVRLERVVPLGDTFVPYLWVSNEDAEDIDDVLDSEPDIASFRIVDVADGEALVRVEWAGDHDEFFTAMTETDAAILEGTCEAGVWRFQLRVDDHDRLAELYRRCLEHDIRVGLERVYHQEQPAASAVAVDLTDAQEEVLRVAFEEGYFDVPRRTNLVELADRIGISDSAVSQRIRRGIATVLTATLAEPGDGE